MCLRNQITKFPSQSIFILQQLIPIQLLNKPFHSNMAVEFNWNLHNLDESQLHALAVLAQIYFQSITNNTQNPQQAVHSADDNNHDGSSNSDDSSPEVDPACEPEVDQYTGEFVPYGDDYLKRRFLNRLAEIWARDTGREYVSATVLQETQEGVTIWLARNRNGPVKLRQEHCEESTEDKEFMSIIFL